jgi:hypothetical protein
MPTPSNLDAENKKDGTELKYVENEANKWASKHPILWIIVWDNRIRKYFEKTSNDKNFNNLIMFFIMINTLTLSYEQYGLPLDVQNFLNVVNLILTYILLIEMIIKIYGWGF